MRKKQVKKTKEIGGTNDTRPPRPNKKSLPKIKNRS